MARKKKKSAKRSAAKKKTPAKKTKKTKSKARRAAPAKRAKTKTKRATPKAKPKAKKKKTAKRAAKSSVGEGNYAATRSFDKAEASFVKKNRAKIPAMGKEAEKALEGPEGAELISAEAEARAHGLGIPGDL